MEIQIPDAFVVRDCEKCKKHHAPIRDCTKTYLLAEVKQGLRAGRSYKHTLDDGLVGWEYVKFMDGRRFFHSVVGSDWGGAAELDISIMTPERWKAYGWELDD